MKRVSCIAMVVIGVILVAGPSWGQVWTDHDATVYVDVSSVWTATGVTVSYGEELSVLAKGTYSAWGSDANSWHHWFGPDGVTPDQAGGCVSCPVPGYPGAALIAKIGTGDPFYVGSFASFQVQASGELMLGINDYDALDNRGTLVAFIRGGSPITAAPAVVPSTDLGWLDQNVPNPFNPSTAIPYTTSEYGRVEVRIYNITGALVRSLVDEPQSPGLKRVVWDGTDDRGQQVASGNYMYSLWVNGTLLATNKAIMLK